jgi:hypothetical protein
VSVPQYHENLVSLVYPGNQASQTCLHPTVAAVERVLGLTPAQRRRTVLRLDGGFGTDGNVTVQVVKTGITPQRTLSDGFREAKTEPLPPAGQLHMRR